MKRRLTAIRFWGLGRLAPIAPVGHRLRIWVLRRIYRWAIGSDTTIDHGIRLQGLGGVRIGERCNINDRCTIDGRGGVTIGDRVNISAEVSILTASHDLDDPSFAGNYAEVKIGDGVWIATRAMILPGVTVGEGAVVAAGAVVARDVAPFTVVAGNPAAPVRERAREAQRELPRYRRLFH